MSLPRDLILFEGDIDPALRRIGAESPGTARPCIVEVVIPAYNEEESLPLVMADIPRTAAFATETEGREAATATTWPIVVRRVVVADNNSRDRTAEVARAAGAVVVPAPQQGYGSACLAALEEVRRPTQPVPAAFLETIAEGEAAERARAAASRFAVAAPAPPHRQWMDSPPPGPPDVVVFLDADYSDHPEEMRILVSLIATDAADFVIGSRTLGEREPGAMLPQARFGNWLATTLIRLFWGHRYTDLGPFRAARWEAFEALDMSDPDFGWTVELQVKAIERGFRVVEVPVSYRRRIGVSKITGTISGTFRAGIKILSVIARHRLRGWFRRPSEWGATGRDR
jgi:glycosyltransferase involved in cell wall biosynthesis